MGCRSTSIRSSTANRSASTSRRLLAAGAALVVVAAACSDGREARKAITTTTSTSTSTTVAVTTTIPVAATTTRAAAAPTRATTPAAPTPGPSLAGCALFPPDNPWRRDVSKDALDSHSAAWIAGIGRDGHLHADFGADPTYGIPYVV